MKQYNDNTILDLTKKFVSNLDRLGISVIDADMGSKWCITADTDNTAKLLNLFAIPKMQREFKVNKVESDRELVDSKDYALIYGNKEVFTIYGELA